VGISLKVEIRAVLLDYFNRKILSFQRDVNAKINSITITRARMDTMTWERAVNSSIKIKNPVEYK
jgi:hypothetical protein